MSIYRSLNKEALSHKSMDGWHLNLAATDAKNKPLNFPMYEDSITNSIASYLEGLPSDLVSNSVTIPIVFHLILDDTEIISLDKGYQITFNVTNLLQDINNVFEQAQIKFVPAKRNEKGELLKMAGVNIIDAKNLFEYRQVSGAGSIRKYSDEGVSITNLIYNRNVSLGPTERGGYSYKSLLHTHSWDSKSIINILLINKFENNKTVLMAPNPYKVDMLNEESFDIVLPFFALGSPQRYGYSYTKKTPAQLEVYNSLNGFTGTANTSIAYFGIGHHSAKPLLKGLGHLFGLASSNVFDLHLVETESNYSDSSCNNYCIYSDYRNKSYCGSCDNLDTNKYYEPWVKGSDCDNGDDIFISLSENIMSYYKTDNAKYKLSTAQILRIKANLGLKYIDEETQIPFQGSLSKLSQSSWPSDRNYNTPVGVGRDAVNSCEEFRTSSPAAVSRMSQGLNNYSALNNNSSNFNFIKIVNCIKTITEKNNG